MAKKIINNNLSHHHSSVFDPASPAVTKLVAPAGRVANCKKDHIDFGAAASPVVAHAGTKRPQAADHVDAVLHSIPPEAKKTRQGSVEEQQNKNKATTDHISNILTAPTEAPTTAEAKVSNAQVTRTNPIQQQLAPTDRSSETRGHTGKRMINNAAGKKTGVTKTGVTTKTITKNHNKSSVFSTSTGDEENSGKRQSESSNITTARHRMLGSHVLGCTEKGSTPVKRSGVRVSNQNTSESMGSIFNWG